MTSRRKKSIIRIVVWICITVLVFGSIYAPSFLNEYKENVAKDSVVYIAQNSSFNQMLDSLSGHLKDLKSFEKYAKRMKLFENIHPGRYILNTQMRNKDIVRMIVNGWQKPFMLTLSGNIRGLEKMAAVLGNKLAADSLSFINCFNDSSVFTKYGFQKQNFMSMFIPNTYEVYWTVTPKDFVQRMFNEYERFWNAKRCEKAKLLGMSKIEVSTLASIVCEETNYAPEMPDIAGVYINRLKKGMRLEADPTVKFALGDPSIRRILLSHLQVESPYNTYKVTGLPYGPITIPSIKAIDAVLNYNKHNYLYFCANSSMNGSHKFASSLSEHNKNAREYWNALNKLRIK